MSNLDKPHKCVFAKCKGRLKDPKENYGHWAYWDHINKNGWLAKPPAEEKKNDTPSS